MTTAPSSSHKDCEVCMIGKRMDNTVLWALKAFELFDALNTHVTPTAEQAKVEFNNFYVRLRLSSIFHDYLRQLSESKGSCPRRRLALALAGHLMIKSEAIETNTQPAKGMFGIVPSGAIDEKQKQKMFEVVLRNTIGELDAIPHEGDQPDPKRRA